MIDPKSFTLKARFAPDAKKPPKGAKTLVKSAMTTPCNWIDARLKVTPPKTFGRPNMDGRKTVDGVQCTLQRILQSVNSGFGHVINSQRLSNLDTKNPEIKVVMPPYMRPSHVFFGLRAVSGVFPNIRPKMYEKLSFIATQTTGSKNQIIPIFTLRIMKFAQVITTKMAIWDLA
mmetsp:Transcript_876/g.2231  ORF Transcript_876/g.2231 Transcript_876/m.2231 type:complete len:174 (-) Transcript_876:664-1185(-)